MNAINIPVIVIRKTENASTLLTTISHATITIRALRTTFATAALARALHIPAETTEFAREAEHAYVTLLTQAKRAAGAIRERRALTRTARASSLIL